MLKKISLKKLAQLARGSKGASLLVMSTSTAIGEKRPQSEVPDIKPTKKGKLTSNAKGKGSTSPTKRKKKSP